MLLRPLRCYVASAVLAHGVTLGLGVGGAASRCSVRGWGAAGAGSLPSRPGAELTRGASTDTYEDRVHGILGSLLRTGVYVLGGRGTSFTLNSTSCQDEDRLCLILHPSF